MRLIPLLLAGVAATAFAGSSRGAEPAKALTSPESVRGLCETLRPVERVDFSAAGQDTAKARAAYESARESARQTSFTAELPWSGYAVSEWDAKAGQVTLSTERPFRALSGALNLVDADRDEVVLQLLPEQKEALAAGLSKGTLSLLLTFRPAEADDNPCVTGKAGTYTMLVDLLTAELRAAGEAVARASGDGFLPVGRAGGKPTVSIRPAPMAEKGQLGPALSAGLEKVRPALEKCYAQALSAKPTLDGQLIVALEVKADGAIAWKDVLVDSLQDADATACVRQAIDKARAKAGTPGSAVVIELERK